MAQRDKSDRESTQAAWERTWERLLDMFSKAQAELLMPKPSLHTGPDGSLLVTETTSDNPDPTDSAFFYLLDSWFSSSNDKDDRYWDELESEIAANRLSLEQQ